MGDLNELRTDFIEHPRPMRIMLLGMDGRTVEGSKGDNGTGLEKQQRLSRVYSTNKSSKGVRNQEESHRWHDVDVME